MRPPDDRPIHYPSAYSRFDRTGRSRPITRRWAGPTILWTAVVVLTMFTGSIASAQEYPVTAGTLSVQDTNTSADGDAATANDGHVAVGQELRIAGGGFEPGSEVTITIESEPVVLAVTIADANGEIDISVVIPEDMPVGDHALKAAGDSALGGRLVLEQPVTVTPPGAPLSADDTASGPSPLRRILMVSLAATVIAAAAGTWYWRRPDAFPFSLLGSRN